MPPGADPFDLIGAEPYPWGPDEEHTTDPLAGQLRIQQRQFGTAAVRAFDRLLKDATRRRFDIIMAWSVDRLGRSIQDLVGFLSDIHAQGVDLYLDRQGVDTTTPGGKAMFQMMGVFAEFERAMIQERVKAGLARAVARGAKLGRPQISMRKERQIREARAEGLSIRQIAARCQVSLGTAHRVCTKP